MWCVLRTDRLCLEVEEEEVKLAIVLAALVQGLTGPGGETCPAAAALQFSGAPELEAGEHSLFLRFDDGVSSQTVSKAFGRIASSTPFPDHGGLFRIEELPQLASHDEETSSP